MLDVSPLLILSNIFMKANTVVVRIPGKSTGRLNNFRYWLPDRVIEVVVDVIDPC